MSGKKRIGELLLEAEIITSEQLQDALQLQKKLKQPLVECLIELGYLDEETFRHFLARQPGTPSLDIQSCAPSKDVLALIPAELAVQRQVLPLDRMGRVLTVAMVCPLDRMTIDAVAECSGLRVHPVLCSAKEMDIALARYYNTVPQVFTLL